MQGIKSKIRKSAAIRRNLSREAAPALEKTSWRPIRKEKNKQTAPCPKSRDIFNLISAAIALDSGAAAGSFRRKDFYSAQDGPGLAGASAPGKSDTLVRMNMYEPTAPTEGSLLADWCAPTFARVCGRGRGREGLGGGRKKGNRRRGREGHANGKLCRRKTNIESAAAGEYSSVAVAAIDV